LALTGGEDYELLITAQPADAAKIKAKVEGKTKVPLTIIGEIVAGAYELEVIGADGRVVPQRRAGYEHFTGA
jgi:thiamine-monophosphate kinase